MYESTFIPNKKEYPPPSLNEAISSNIIKLSTEGKTREYPTNQYMISKAEKKTRERENERNYRN